MKSRWIVASAAVAVAVGGALVGVAPANADANDPLATVAKATPSTVANAANVTTRSTGTNAVQATVSGTVVTVPVDPAAGISLGAGANTVSVGLPFASKAGKAAVQKPGVVSYDNNNGSTTVPVVQKDGSLQINTVIKDANAPKRYDYPIAVPAGERLQLAADGSAFVGTAAGPSITIGAPWAKDATGKQVPTHYEVHGNTLVQVVGFTSNTAFPVVADPTYWWGGKVWLSPSQVSGAGAAAAVSAVFAPAAPAAAVMGAALMICNSAGRGIWVYWTWVGHVWCTGP